MAYGNFATSPKRLESELTNITRRDFCSLPVFRIDLLSLIGIFFRYLFVLTYFDSSTTHAQGNTREGVDKTGNMEHPGT